VPVANEIRDTERDDARLPRSGAGEDQQRPFGMKNGFALFGIELVEESVSRGPFSIAATLPISDVR
jgi:hypothetical protein